MIYDVSEIVDRAAALGISIEQLCRGAGVHSSLLHKWKADRHSPTMRVLRKLTDELDKLEAQYGKRRHRQSWHPRRS